MKETEERQTIIDNNYAARMEKQRSEKEIQRRAETMQLEEVKNEQINQLLRNHEKAFADIRDYYNDITLNNVQLIKELKAVVLEMKIRDDKLEKKVIELLKENEGLKKPLRKAEEELVVLHKEVRAKNVLSNQLSHTIAKLKTTKNEFSDLKYKHEVLQQRFDVIKQENDKLYNEFVKSLMEVQRRLGLKNILLERKIEKIHSECESKTILANELFAQGDHDIQSVQAAEERIKRILDAKNHTIKQLQFELSKAAKRDNDMLRVFKAVMEKHNIQLDFKYEPLEHSGIPNCWSPYSRYRRNQQ